MDLDYWIPTAQVLIVYLTRPLQVKILSPFCPPKHHQRAAPSLAGQLNCIRLWSLHSMTNTDGFNLLNCHLSVVLIRFQEEQLVAPFNFPNLF